MLFGLFTRKIAVEAANLIRANQINLADVFAFTANNTHAGAELFASLNGIIYVDRQAGATADVKINACVTALTNGGICDARGFGATTQTIAATVTVGSNSGSGKTITLLLDRTTKFNCTITNNTACIVLDPGSAILAPGPIANPNAGIFLTAPSVVSNIILVQSNIGLNLVASSMDGVTAFGFAGATVSDALVGIQNPLQINHHKNLSISANGITNAVMLKIYGTSGLTAANVEINNVSIDAQGLTGNRPVWIGCAASGSLTPISCSQVDAISFTGPSAIVHPGSGGIPIIQIEASNGAGGTNAVGNINFYGTQIESKNTGDIGILDDGAESVHVYGLHATCATNCGADLIKLSQPAGTTLDGVIISGVDNQGGWTNTLNNTVLTKTITYASGAARLNYLYNRTGAASVNLWDDAGGTEFVADPTSTRGRNIPILASLVTTAATSDNVTVTGMTASGHCVITPTNTAAAANIATTYVSSKTTNQITVTHAVTANMNYDIACTSN